jgi:F0F1-type ATP synthase assembly protein I
MMDRSKQLVSRMVLWQAGCAVAIALLFMLSSLPAALAAAAGGLSVALGNALFGQRMFAAGVAPTPVIVFGMLAGVVLKWVIVLAAIWLALAVAHWPALPLIVGVFGAYVAFWLGSFWLR